jgi:uncharacterized phage protein (TIGR02220 family)
MAIEIVDWDKHYENNRTRELKQMQWVPIPNRQDGDGYTELLDHKNGPSHFGAWCALVQVASRCDPRGTLLRDSAVPHDEASLARMTRIPFEVWKEALPRLLSIGWIKGYGIPHEGATIPHPSAMNGMEGNGKKEGNTLSAKPTTQYQSIITRLNEKAGTSFKASSKATCQLIKARFADGFTEEDFFTVIDAKCAQWKSDPKMMEFLRPSTLFSPKFEGYLQAAKNAVVVAEDQQRKKSEQRDSRAPAGRY